MQAFEWDSGLDHQVKQFTRAIAPVLDAVGEEIDASGIELRPKAIIGAFAVILNDMVAHCSTRGERDELIAAISASMAHLTFTAGGPVGLPDLSQAFQ